jgi:hypothetical protein
MQTSEASRSGRIGPTMSRRWAGDNRRRGRGPPIFPVSDLAAALAYYRGLGFGARRWQGGGHGFVTFPAGDRMGQHEGVLTDPGGNVIRFGSPMDAD